MQGLQQVLWLFGEDRQVRAEIEITVWVAEFDTGYILIALI